MKRIYAFAMSAALTLGVAFAGTGPVLSKIAKPLNLKEVSEAIVYPTLTRANGVEGKVLVVLEIDEQGKVMDNVVISSPCKQLKAAVEAAVTNLRFDPAVDTNGQPMACKVRLPFEFKLTVD